MTVTISKNAASSDTYATTIDSSPYPTLTSPITNSSTTTPETPSAPSSKPDQTQDSAPQDSTQPDAQSAESQPNVDWTEIAIFTVVGVVIALLIFVIALLRRRVQNLERKIGGSGLN